jgi:hypothetical protein
MGLSSTRILAGLGVAAAALTAFVFTSAIDAPVARADDPITDILTNVATDYSNGQAAFDEAALLFGSNDITDGFASLLSGVDDDVVSAPNDLINGPLEELAGDPISGAAPVHLFVPTDVANAEFLAQEFFSSGESSLPLVSSFLASGDYLDAAAYAQSAVDSIFVIAPEYLFLGGLESLGF